MDPTTPVEWTPPSCQMATRMGGQMDVGDGIDGWNGAWKQLQSWFQNGLAAWRRLHVLPGLTRKSPKANGG